MSVCESVPPLVSYIFYIGCPIGVTCTTSILGYITGANTCTPGTLTRQLTRASRHLHIIHYIPPAGASPTNRVKTARYNTTRSVPDLSTPKRNSLSWRRTARSSSLHVIITLPLIDTLIICLDELLIWCSLSCTCSIVWVTFSDRGAPR